MRIDFDLRRIFGTVNTRSIYAYSILIGLVAGVGAIVFNELLHQASTFMMHGLVRLPVPEPAGEGLESTIPVGPTRRWMLVVLPVFGGLISGYLVKRFAPEAEGTGTDSYIDAFHNRGGVMRTRVPLIKSAATIATLASGGSAGREGPVAQIGAGVGSALGSLIRVGARARRTLMVAGAAAGLGAIFRAPLGGALTAVEVLYKEDLETDALTPAILASVTAYTVFCSVNGFSHIFAFSHGIFHSPVELLFYAVLGLVCSGAGFVYVKFLHGTKRHLFDRLPLHPYLIPPLGGLLVGLIGYWYPEAMGQGFGYVQQLISGDPVGALGASIGALALLAVLKIMTTSFTISSGGSGGVFGPSLFIGAMLGGCVGTLSHQWFPDLVPEVGPFVVVGMGAFFAGVANAPIASLVMVSELTGAYELLPPLMVVATVALVTSRGWSIYVNQVDNKFFSRAHLWEMNPNVLRAMTIGEMTRGVYHQRAIIPDHLPLPQVEAFAAETGESDLVLRDGDGDLAGLVSLRDLGDRGQLEGLGDFVLALDLINRQTLYLKPDDNLIRALEFFSGREFDKVPIVTTTGDRLRLLGHIEYDDIIGFYKREHGTTPSALDPPASQTGAP